MNDTSLKHFYDAREAGRSIMRFASGKTYEDYCGDEMMSAAIERKFEIIGESLARIRRENPADLTAIGAWPAIIGFRNILAHAYDHVEDSVVWGIVQSQLPLFLKELEAVPGLDSPAGE
jgi:uncharacterized protein with HEPN domain